MFPALDYGLLEFGGGYAFAALILCSRVCFWFTSI